MTTWLLQPWTTVTGPRGVALTQLEYAWLDLSDFTDVELILSVRNASFTSLSVVYETSPSKDEELFAAMATVALTAPPVARDVQLIKFASATEPLARWVRWRIFDAGGPGDWSITFRIWVRAVAAGGIRCHCRRQGRAVADDAYTQLWKKRSLFTGKPWILRPSIKETVVARADVPIANIAEPGHCLTHREGDRVRKSR